MTGCEAAALYPERILGWKFSHWLWGSLQWLTPGFGRYLLLIKMFVESWPTAVITINLWDPNPGSSLPSRTHTLPVSPLNKLPARTSSQGQPKRVMHLAAVGTAFCYSSHDCTLNLVTPYKTEILNWTLDTEADQAFPSWHAKTQFSLHKVNVHEQTAASKNCNSEIMHGL